MVTFTFTVNNENGLHARPAGLLVKEAMQCKSSIIFKKDGKQGDAKKIFNVMGLSVKHGDVVTAEVTGDTEAEDSERLQKFIAENL